MSTMTQTPDAATAASVWTLDPAHSSIHFHGRQMMISTVRGRFSRFDATVVGSDTEPENARVSVTIDAASVDTNMPQRDQHLTSPDFLDVARYPEITFRSTSIRRLEGDRLLVRGDVTVRGVTRQVEFEATLNGQGVGMSGSRTAAFSADVSIDRHLFEITWNMPLGGDAVLVGREITLQFELTFQESGAAAEAA